MARSQRAPGISEEPMNIRNLGRSMRFILGAASACALVACAENTIPAPVQPAATRNVCDEAKDYRGRAAAADSAGVRAALQRIADSKSHECAAAAGDDRRDNAPWRGSAREGMGLSPAQSRPHTSM
jgi:hypothetical protein